MIDLTLAQIAEIVGGDLEIIAPESARKSAAAWAAAGLAQYR